MRRSLRIILFALLCAIVGAVCLLAGTLERRMATAQEDMAVLAKVKGEQTPAKALVPLQLFTADKPDDVKTYVGKYEALAH